MDVFCPGCGRRGRVTTARPGMALSCPSCGRRWTLDAGRPPSSPHRGSPAAPLDAGARLARWGLWAGIAILIGLAMPVVGSGWSPDGSRLVISWPWEFWKSFDAGTKTGMAILAGLAVALIVAARATRGPARSVSMFLLALGTLVVHVASPGAGVAVGIGFPLLFLGIGVAAALLAASNRLRKSHADAYWLRLVAVVAGAIGVGLFFLEASAFSESLANALFSAEAWKNGIAVGIALAVVFATFALALLHLLPGRGRGIASLLSFLARACAFAVPLALIASPLIAGGPGSVEATVTTAAVALKGLVLVVYPGLIVMGLALVPLGARLASRGAIAAGDAVPAAPPAPRPAPAPSSVQSPARERLVAPPAAAPVHEPAPAVGDGDPAIATLRRKLARLRSAHAEGLLTDDEYAAKRKEIVGDFEF